MTLSKKKKNKKITLFVNFRRFSISYKVNLLKENRLKFKKFVIFLFFS